MSDDEKKVPQPDQPAPPRPDFEKRDDLSEGQRTPPSVFVPPIKRDDRTPPDDD
jgi:hypothetical protein